MPTLPARLAVGAGAVAVALALVLALVWLSRASETDWSSQQRAALRVLVESELPQATTNQQICVVDYVTGRFSPEDWTATVQRYAELRPFSGTAIFSEATASGCAAK